MIRYIFAMTTAIVALGFPREVRVVRVLVDVLALALGNPPHIRISVRAIGVFLSS